MIKNQKPPVDPGGFFYAVQKSISVSPGMQMMVLQQTRYLIDQFSFLMIT